ncbi:hypothetical protein, partial [Helicobacter pullorum]|uniref:hypothetical protein n=1 Tax=Helicobacter pullorum TaxID=35818 RepID=UPI000AAEFD46
GGGIKEYANYKKISISLLKTGVLNNTPIELPKGVEIFHKFTIFCVEDPNYAGFFVFNSGAIDYSGEGRLVDNRGLLMRYQQGNRTQKGDKVGEGSFSFMHNQNRTIYITTRIPLERDYGNYYGDFEFWW